MNALINPVFRPHPLLRSGHLQTVLAPYLYGAHFPYKAVMHDVLTRDDDIVVLHDDCPNAWLPGDRVVLLVHGLCGSHLSTGMVRTAGKLNSRGYRTFRMDLRACGAAAGKSRLPFNGGQSNDLADCLEYLARICPGSPVSMVGFSMGGNLTLKLVGEAGLNPPGGLDSAIAITPPVNLLRCAFNLSRGMNRFYDRTFLYRMMTFARQHQQRQPGVVNGHIPRSPRHMRDFDSQFTAPIAGFASAKHYYRESSSEPWLASIRVPTLILTAADDPIIPVDMLHRTERSTACDLYIADHGGHMGFLGVSGVDPDRRWLEWRIVDWVEHIAKKLAVCV